MQKRAFKTLLILLLCLIIFFVFKKCSNNRPVSQQKPGTVYYVPQDATIVFAFEIEQVLNEIEFNDLKNNSTYQSNLAQYYSQNPPFTKVFSDPTIAGIDINSKAVFYLDVGDNMDEVYTASILPLQSKSSFGEMIKSLNLTEESFDLYEIAQIDPASSVAWNDDMVIFLTTSDAANKEDLLDNIFSKRVKKYYDEHPTYQDYFESFEDEAAFWVDLGAYAKNQILATGKEGEFNELLLQGNYIYGIVDFDKGMVNSSINFDLNPVIQKSINNLFSERIDKAILAKMPSKDPSFLGLVSLDIDGLFGLLLSTPDLKLEARNSLAEYGIMVEDFGKAFTGEVIFGGFRREEAANNAILFGLKIKDLKHFDQLLEVMYQLGKIEQIENNLYRMNTSYVPFMPFNVTYEDGLQRMLIKEEYMFVSLNKEVIDALQSRKHVDLKHLNTKSENEVLSFYGDKEFQSLKEYTDQFAIQQYAAGFDGKTLTISLNLLEKNKSSLKQLLNLD